MAREIFSKNVGMSLFSKNFNFSLKYDLKYDTYLPYILTFYTYLLAALIYCFNLLFFFMFFFFISFLNIRYTYLFSLLSFLISSNFWNIGINYLAYFLLLLKNILDGC